MTDAPILPAALTKPPMVAFHGDIAIKARYLKRVRAHAKADQLVQGYGYWKDGKGCAVGCTLHSGSHAAYETELGIPSALAYLEDRIFENLPVAEARTWPERFLAAARPGADLTPVPWQMVHWLLTDQIPPTGNTEVENLRARLIVMLEPLMTGGPHDRAAFRALLPAARAIRDRAWTARRAAWTALYAARRRRDAAAAAAAAAVAEAAVVAEAEAEEAAVAAVAEAAVEEAVAAAAVAAEAEAAVAEAAVAAEAEAAVAAVVVWSTSRRAAFVRQSEKLLELMSQAA